MRDLPAPKDLEHAMVEMGGTDLLDVLTFSLHKNDHTLIPSS